eukprot:5203138-Amphidinium_carterae.1
MAIPEMNIKTSDQGRHPDLASIGRCHPERVKTEKTPTTHNPADVLTKHLRGAATNNNPFTP